MDEAFDARACALPACSSGNIIAAGGDRRARRRRRSDELEAGALRLKRDTGLNLLPTVARIARLQAGISDRFVL